jgi:CheY-like chemotaxis protein
LLGEDDPDDEELLSETFRRVDPSFSQVFINNGRKFIEYLDSVDPANSPCLIVLDYNMPEMNGEEILKRMRASGQFLNIPKIIWSTSGSDTYRRACMDLGATDYIIKPSNIKDLEETVRYMVSFC